MTGPTVKRSPAAQCPRGGGGIQTEGSRNNKKEKELGQGGTSMTKNSPPSRPKKEREEKRTSTPA